MNIGITGASGMLGTALLDRLHTEHEIYATSRKQGAEKSHVIWECFDLLQKNKLRNWLDSNHLDVVIQCAAIVNVDLCEQLPEMAEKLHYETTKIIAKHLQKNDGHLIYISTDSLFDGKKTNPYTEEDETNPLNIYAKTKLAGEDPALNIKNGLVLRTNIIGCINNENDLSFAEWIISGLVEMKALHLFDDVIFSPLHVHDLADIVSQLIEQKTTGLYNATSSTSLSKYEFGLMIADVFSIKNHGIIKSSVKDKKIFEPKLEKSIQYFYKYYEELNKDKIKQNH